MRQLSYKPRYSEKYDFWHSSRKEYQSHIKRLSENMEKQCEYVSKSYRKHKRKRIAYNVAYNREWRKRK